MANIYRVSQDVNNDYDTYDSAIVVAESEDEARAIHPGNDGTGPFIYDGGWHIRHSDGSLHAYYNTSWCLPADVRVELLGEAAKGFAPGTVLCASFNAG